EPIKPTKKLVRRADKDYSQKLRRGFQIGFLLWNVYLGGLFYLWVRHYETGMQTRAVTRPAGVEGWLPIAGLMNLKYCLVMRRVPEIHPAAMFLLITFLAVAFLLRKAFCSWLCPVGTMSEYLWRLGRKLFGRNFVAPRWLDIPLRGLKYLLLGFFVWAVATMPAESIAGFMRSPYGVIADVKMLNFFRHISETGLIVLAALVVASVFLQNFWCRYLCPYGGLLGLASLLSPLRIRRDAEACIDCAKCAKACPSHLTVDKLVSIKSAECTGCMECVAVCPAEGALHMGVPKILHVPDRGRMPAWAMAAGIAVLVIGITGFAKSAGYWKTDLPRSVYLELVPSADQASHPMPGDPALNQ
ncbi:MAG TPA: 4Fe-4S binding protein, partial [Bryobacteraceae bacterium]|nr:4Fe-4S binding protein [Bryobacteraceae bacterium]